MSEHEELIDERIEPYQLWVYPTLDINKDMPSLDETSQMLPPEETEEIIQESALNHELNEKIASLDAQYQLIQNISSDMNAVLNSLDQTLLDNILHCVKKITKKIILKELDASNDALTVMIEDALKTIKNQKPATLFLSEENHERLKNEPAFAGILLKIDPNLDTSDFRIESSTNQITAILEDRLNNLFGLSS